MQGYETDAAESYLNWWQLAGVDYLYSDEPQPFLAPPPALSAFDAPADSRGAAAQNASPAAPANVAQRIGTLPDTLEGFYDWLATSPALPGAHWSQHRILPRGNPQSGFMVISDCPDGADMEQRQLFSGGPGKLLTAMLKAIDIDLDDVLLTPFSYTRPPGGRIDPENGRILLSIMHHHLKLLQPKRLLLLGDKTSRALVGTDLREGRGWLRDVNYDGAKVASVVTFHPRFLLERPQFKRDAWQDLKMFKKDLI